MALALARLHPLSTRPSKPSGPSNPSKQRSMERAERVKGVEARRDGGAVITRFPTPSTPTSRSPAPPVTTAPKTHTSSVSLYVCPYSEQKYSGACPVTKCPANIRAKQHPSACMHNCFPDKDLGVHEVAFALGADLTALKQDHEQGMESLRNLVLLERCLDWVRVRKLKNAQCSCGAVIGASACTVSRCRNKKRGARLLSRYPFTVEPLEATAADIGKLFYWRADLERVFKTDLLHICGVSAETFERYMGRSSN